MPRKLRVEYPGAIYHVMNRGNQRQNIFRDDQDRECFLGTLTEACAKTGWEIHAYCLMRNHFHLVIETPRADLVAGMKWLMGVYTQRFNIRHKTCGHLFAGRYQAFPVDGSGNGYLQTVCDYVHLNPVRAGLIQPGELIESFPWSSYPQYLADPGKRPSWLRADRLFGEKGIPRDTTGGRAEFARQMQLLALEPFDEEKSHLARGGWCLGSDEFKKELIAAMEGKAGPAHYGSDRQETGVHRAERLLTEGLKRLRLGAESLQRQPKGEPRKIELARELRENTPMTLNWIADRLHMGSGSYLYHLLSKGEKQRQK